MTPRDANIVTLKRQPDMRYLVANGCPHARPNTAPFYACMAGMTIHNGEHNGFVQIAKCEYIVASDQGDHADRIIHCSYGDESGPGDVAGQLGVLGVPTVTHGQGESDGGEPD